MLNKKIEVICNRQVEREGYSSNLYLAMASWAENAGLNGIAAWMYIQSDEERTHMLKFVKYINERGGKAIMPAFTQPPAKFSNVEEVFKEVLKHEEFVTQSINEIVALSLELKDFSTNSFLQWFVNEQVEEEASAKQILDKIHLIGKNNMYELDRDIVSLRNQAAKAINTP
jgi:ferritin